MSTIDEKRLESARSIVDRGVIVDALPNRESFIERLASEEPMRIYIGADPTSTALHLSHAKNYMLLEEFRKLGHEVIVLFGDFTARIGDPSDRMSARKQLSSEEVTTNVTGWLEQIRPLMDFDTPINPPQVKFNADWLAKLTMEDVVNLASMVTVQRMLERDMFEKRMKEEVPIHMHEFLYPLMQGYDSVAMEVDAELCGTDQTFNALMGRTLLKQLKGKEKYVVIVNLMENPKTGELMSKSRGTGIFLNTDAFNMFGAIMSLPDEMTEVLLVNNTRIPLSEIAELLKNQSPMDAKLHTAFEVTRIFHGEESATEAQERFDQLVRKKTFSENVPEIFMEHPEQTVFSVARNCLDEGTSNGQIRRLIEQGSIKIDGKKEADKDGVVTLTSEGLLLKVGKKQWFRVKLAQ